MSEERLLPNGRQILARIEASGGSLPPEDAEAVLEISDDEAMAKFLAANVGDTVNPEEMEANSVFSGWLMNRINIPPMLLTVQFDNLGQCTRAINFCYDELARERMTAEERNNVLRTLVEAIRQKGLLVKNVLQMAQAIKPPKRKSGPRNQPPDTLRKPSQVVVQINNQVQAPKEETGQRPLDT